MSAVIDFPVNPETRPYLESACRGRRGEPDWLAAPSRAAALARFAEQGFPSRRSESLALPRSAAAGTVTDAAARHDRRDTRGASRRYRRLPTLRIVWCWSMAGLCLSFPRLRGCRRASGSARRHRRSTRSRIWCARRSTALAATEIGPFAALNAAFFADGFVLDVAPGVVLERPIEIVHLASGEASRFAAYPQLHDARRREPGPADREFCRRGPLLAQRCRQPSRLAAGSRTRSRGISRGGGGRPPFRRCQRDARRKRATRRVCAAARRPHGAA